MHPGSTAAAAKTPTGTEAAADSAAPAPAAAAPLAFQDVPNSDGSSAPTDTSVTTTTPATTGAGNSVGVEVLTPGANGSPAPAESNGLHAVGPGPTRQRFPPLKKQADAPEQVNDIQPGAQQAAAQTPNDNGKKTKSPQFDKGDESSSKHKKKKGIDKLNPF